MNALKGRRELVLLLTSVFLISMYFILRYEARWGEVDTSAAAMSIREMLDAGTLVPERAVYPNGYGFQSLSVFLVHISDLLVTNLQLFGSSILALWIVILGWIAYREMTGSVRAATLATTIILVQPEFLFAMLRGTHEKFTRGLMLLCLFLIFRTLSSRKSVRELAAYLIAFYLIIYALITFNNLLAISFIFALGFSLLGTLLVSKFFLKNPEIMALTNRRLFYAVCISLILAFVFTFYAYWPARHDIEVISRVSTKVAVLVLDVEPDVDNPYSAITTGWIHPQIYLLLTLANWTLLLSSVVIWFVVSIEWFRTASWPRDPKTILLWLSVAAFGFLGVLAIAADITSDVTENLQHRIFPSFAMIAAPFVAKWLVERLEFRSASNRPLTIGLAAVITVFSLLALIKGTNEPAISNKWMFYKAGESVAVGWSQKFNPNQRTWVSYDERLRETMLLCCADKINGELLDVYEVGVGTTNFLISTINNARAIRLGVNPPVSGTSLHIYDNGEASILHRRPLTLFQK